jgi:quinol monooxygenase YgiN
MYGTLYRLQPRAGQEQAVLDHLFRWEQEYLPGVSGYVGGYLFQPTSEPFELIGILVFESPNSYRTHRDNPEHARWQQHLLAMLEQVPLWHEGEFSELSAELRGL